MKRLIQFLLFPAVVCLFASIAIAQEAGTSQMRGTESRVNSTGVPRVISYQAVLERVDGNARTHVPDGEYIVHARIYAGEDALLPIWSDSYRTQIEGGLVTLMLGSGYVPLPASEILSRPLWLGIAIADGDELRPLTPFGAVPYALTVPDGAITASKLAADYVSSIAVGGRRVTHRASEVNLLAGNGVTLEYDPIADAIVIGMSDSLISPWLTRGKGLDVLAVDFEVKGDLSVSQNAILNVEGGATDIRGNVILGSSNAKTITFNAKAASDLNMAGYSVNNADSLSLGVFGQQAGVLRTVTRDKQHRATIVADSAIEDRTYKIPYAKEGSRFIMSDVVQRLDTVIYTHIVVPKTDNSFTLGEDSLRYKDVYLGPGSLHLLAGQSDGVQSPVEWSHSIDVESDNDDDGFADGDFTINKSGQGLFRISQEGNVNVTGKTSTDGISTSGDIKPQTDNAIKIGSGTERIADIYLGTGSLHLASTSDETVVQRDWSTGIIVEDSATDESLVGAYQIKEGGVMLMNITSSTGDMSVSGEMQSSGVTTSGDIQLTEDDTYAIGTPEYRVADIYLGTGSLHLASTSDETVVERDWSTGIIVEDSATNSDAVGAYQVKEGGVALMTLAPTTGDMTVSGELASSGLTTSGDIALAEDDVYAIGTPEYRVADIYLGTGSLHLASTSDETVVARDWSTGIIVEDSTADPDAVGAYQVKEGGVALMTLQPATGDLNVTGEVQASGITSSGDITLASDDQYSIGSPDSRVGDIYVGTGSVHWVSTIAETGTPRDWSFGVATSETPQGGDEGSFVLRESGAVLAAIEPDGSLLTSGSIVSSSTVHSALTTALDPANTLTTKSYVDGAPSWNRSGNTGTNASSNFVGTTDAVDLVLRTSNLERLRVLSTGEVGIGTPTPTTALDVEGVIRGSDAAVFGADVTAGGGVFAGGVISTPGAVIAEGGATLGSLTNGGTLSVQDGSGYASTMSPQQLSAMRSVELPDASGTVVLTSTIDDLAVTSVGGTAGRIEVSGTPSSPVLDIASTYAGQPSINTVGTVTTGAWEAALIGVTYGGTGSSTAPTEGGVLFGGSGGVYTSTAAGSSGQVLTSTGSGAPAWTTLPAGWGLQGNSGTDPDFDFIGTTDSAPLIFKTDGVTRLTLGEDASFSGGLTIEGGVVAEDEVTANAGLTVNGLGFFQNDLAVNNQLMAYTAEVSDQLHTVGESYLDGAVTMGADAAVSGVLTVAGVASVTGELQALDNFRVINNSILEGSLLATGTSGTTPASGAGTRMMWVPAKAAFRAGMATGSEWNDGNLGAFSVAFGSSNTASGEGSAAIGEVNVASGLTAVALGMGANAGGDHAFAAGESAEASGYVSAAIGSGVFAGGQHSAALGYHTSATGNYTTALGSNMVLGGHSFGFNTGGAWNNRVELGSYNNIAYLGNVDLWLGNTDGSAKELRFVEPNSTMDYVGTNYTAFKAQAQAENITYTLPAAQGAPGSVLANDGDGTLFWGPRVMQQTVTADVPNVEAGSSKIVTFSVPGATLGSAVYVSPAGPLDDELSISYARVSAVDTVEIKLRNDTAVDADPPSMDWFIGVIK